MNLGAYIRSIRSGKTLTQEDVAEKANLSRNTISGLEKNSDPIRIDNLRKICREVLGVSEREWKEIVVLWLKSLLGDDFSLLETQKISEAMRVRETESIATDAKRFASKLARLEPDIREEVIKALDRREILDCLVPLNAYYESMRPVDPTSGGLYKTGSE